jgi:hypothetical protein
MCEARQCKVLIDDLHAVLACEMDLMQTAVHDSYSRPKLIPEGKQSDRLIKLCATYLSTSTRRIMDYTTTRTESIYRYAAPTRSKSDLPHPSPKRSTPRRMQTTENPSEAEGPWKHMAETYAWVADQEQLKLEKKNKKTAKWVIEQQSFLDDRTNQRDKSPRRTWEECTCVYEVDGEKREVESRRVPMEREEDKAKVIENEIRRIQARVQKKKESEKKRLAEEKLRAAETQKKKREEEERARANVASLDVWRAYEARWASMAASSEPLTFHAVPWPLASRPTGTEGIIPMGITAFLLSPLHSQNQTRKDRIRSALLRWHPDRFHKFLVRVVEEDKTSVQEGAGIVVRCLNELMERETRLSRRETCCSYCAKCRY